ncbi:MAG: AMP-binding protein, partial [Myxococcota bacterium]|nr:AMP-binding protein [Myxococcota bacterium]
MSVISDEVRSGPLWATLPGRLLAHAQARPDAVALRDKSFGIWQPTTWRGYWESVACAGHALAALGVGPGDHVAILSDNRPEWLFADLGTQGIGARSVGIYQTNPPADVAYVVSHSESKVLFCEDQEQVDKAVEIAAQTPSVTAIVVFEPRGTLDYEDPRLMSWEAFLARGRDAEAAAEPDWFEAQVRALDPDVPSMVVYTSGTTGQPKGAMLSPRNALIVPDGMNQIVGSHEGDLILSYLPLCHVAEKIFSLFVPLTVGCVVHFGEAIETVREDLREVSPTIFLGVPRIWEKMHASVTLKMADSSWLKRTLFNLFATWGHGIATRR